MSGVKNYVKYLRDMVGHKPVILTGSVVILLNDKDEVLLQKRATTSYGSWGLLGGLMEMGESSEETARREVKEESGILVGALTLEDVVSGESQYVKVPNGDEFYGVAVVYSCRDFSGEIVVEATESLDIRFHPLDALPEMMVGSHRRMIEKFLG